MCSFVSQLICVTADTGLPLFTRAPEREKALPFPIMGSLNGVDLFARKHGVEIVNTRAGKAKVSWKIFKESLKFIAIGKDCDVSDFQLSVLLENVFNALVLILGISEIEVITNVEKFKKEVRGSFCLIDSLLTGSTPFGCVTQCVDVILCPETSILKERLDAFVKLCDSEFGCLLVHGKIVVATDKWWQLLPSEMMLVMLLIRSMPHANARDFPIYLPHGSPNVPHRLLTMEIIENVEVCVICGPEPSLQDVLVNHLNRYWKSRTMEILWTCCSSHPKNIPSNIAIDNLIDGFILTNLEEGRCLASITPCGNMNNYEVMEVKQRQQVLADFYISVVGTSFSVGDDEDLSNAQTEYLFTHDIVETYQCANKYKLYATQFDNHQMFVLFSKEIPIYAMSTYTERTFRQLTEYTYI